MKKLKICIIDRGLYNGGAAMVMQNYFSHMDRSDLELHLVVHMDSLPYQEKLFKDMGFTIHQLSPMKSSRVNKQNYREYKEFFKTHQFDILHNNASGYVLPTYMAKKYGVPVRILHSHNDFKRSFAAMNALKGFVSMKVIRMNAALGNAYFACSELAALSMFGEKRVREGKVSYIRNAIDVDKYLYNESVREHIRTELGVGDRFVVGHVGRFDDKQKNQKFLIEIFAEIRKQRSDSVLMMIGDGEDIEKRKQQVRDLGIEDSVIFTGNISNVHEYMQAMDVFVFPSKFEGLGIVAVEAQTAGLPLFLSDVIPKEVKATDAVFFLPLADGAKTWADRILAGTADYRRHSEQAELRRSTEKELRSSGYSIAEAAHELHDLYFSLAK